MARILMDTTLGDPGYGKRYPTELTDVGNSLPNRWTANPRP
ncbi:hypothetical protein Mal33_50580 [Rosistilla oblonga]|uniref:Uncharacterized protein n=1 Tax=Rosistilla oblonga TaxID=2527990 RepID=A0A518J111_9BACT|nr:hypothetical protein Mal33_50580 [Rosistilla oblonga]